MVFDFFSRAENLEQITPPWMRFKMLTPLPIEMKPGATIAYALRVRGFPIGWLTEIERWDPPHEFVDVQAKGPYKLWRHTHRFIESGGGTSGGGDGDGSAGAFRSLIARLEGAAVERPFADRSGIRGQSGIQTGDDQTADWTVEE